MNGEGPYFDELEPGQVFTGAPPVTLSQGSAAVHQAIVGDRLRLPLDAVLSAAVTGAPYLAHPALVWDTVIGQSTVATHHVKANLFYRGLAFRRMPHLGDTLTTTTTVEGLRQNRRRPDRVPTGLVALRIRTVDQQDRDVLDFWRCAMLPLRTDRDTGRVDDLDDIGSGADVNWAAAVADWDLDRLTRVPGAGGPIPEAGQRIEVVGGDVVDGATQLARISLNIARVHHDERVAGGRRLVYGGHTIGIALSQASRTLPNLTTVVGWRGCDHTGPVHEGDTLRSVITVADVRPYAAANLVQLRSEVFVDSPVVGSGRQVLDWRYVALFA